jgi:hypothetical protein
VNRQVKLLTEIGADLTWDVCQGRGVPQILMALEECQQGQLLRRPAGVLGDEKLLLITWTVERLEVMGSQ